MNPRRGLETPTAIDVQGDVVLRKTAPKIMASSTFIRLRTYLHLIPVLGVIPSLWTLYGENDVREHYGEPRSPLEDRQEEDREEASVRAASRLSVTIGISCISAIALLGAGASTQSSQMASLRFLMASSFVGSGYFLLSLVLMFRVAKGQSIRLPGVSQLSRRLP